MKFVHKIMYFIQYSVRLLVISMHLSRNTIQIFLYLKSVCFILTRVRFRSHSDSTLDSLPSSKLIGVQYHFLFCFIFSRPLNSIENKSLTIHSIPAYQSRSFFAEEEIDTSCVSLSTKQSRVLTIQKWKVFLITL